MLAELGNWGLWADTSFLYFFCRELKKHRATYTSNIKKISKQVNENTTKRQKVMEDELQLVLTIIYWNQASIIILLLAVFDIPFLGIRMQNWELHLMTLIIWKSKKNLASKGFWKLRKILLLLKRNLKIYSHMNCLEMKWFVDSPYFSISTFAYFFYSDWLVSCPIFVIIVTWFLWWLIFTGCYIMFFAIGTTHRTNRTSKCWDKKSKSRKEWRGVSVSSRGRKNEEMFWQVTCLWIAVISTQDYVT